MCFGSHISEPIAIGAGNEAVRIAAARKTVVFALQTRLERSCMGALPQHKRAVYKRLGDDLLPSKRILDDHLHIALPCENRDIAQRERPAIHIGRRAQHAVDVGDAIVALLLEHGRFTHENTLYVWGVLAGSAVGLLATTVSRLYVSAFYALGDTRTPTRFAVIRVVLVGLLGYVMAIWVPPLIGVPLSWGTAGLTISAGLAGWVEFALLRQALRRRLGDVTMRARRVAHAWAIATGAAILASGLRWVLPLNQPAIRGVVILGVFGTLYLASAQAAGLLDGTSLLRRVLRRR